MKKLIVVFKTHLDLGFTGFSGDILNKYMRAYIPSALDIAKKTRGTADRFVWTTGSWLLEQYLEHCSKLRTSDKLDEFIEAVENGDIRWHALPFTTHTELMTKELFEYGVSISEKLDNRFGFKTIAAKMTDVPGHTKAMIPLLVKAGVKFLHIGVNPASAVPKVPELFKWRYDDENEIVVMYNGEYGEFTEIPGTDSAVYFAHTGDNNGPQSTEQISEMYKDLRNRYPDVEIVAGTLEDVAAEALKAENLPVITSEIGDSWIHGTASDAKKVSGYRALLRYAETADEETKNVIYKNLITVPEHTWGLDEKSFIGPYIPYTADNADHEHFVKADFAKAKETAPYKKMETSWAEQRDYVRNAAKAIGEDKAKEALLGFDMAFPCACGMTKLENPTEPISIGDYNVSVDYNGSISSLSHKGKTLADKEHSFFSFVYNAYSQNEYNNWYDTYVTNHVDWAMEDFGKYGVDKANDCLKTVPAKLENVYKSDNELLVYMSVDKDICDKFGAPRSLALKLTFKENKIAAEFFWKDKDASRVPEALWLNIKPFGEAKAVRKLGEWIDVTDVIDNGNKRMHSTDCGVKYGDVTIKSLDANVVNIGEPTPLIFSNEPVKTDDGVYFNLVNNVWGTNFVMWYSDDASFRFEIEF